MAIASLPKWPAARHLPPGSQSAVSPAHKKAPVLRVFADTNIPPQKWQAVSGGASRQAVEGWIADDFRECA